MKKKDKKKKRKKRSWIHRIPMDYNLFFAIIFLIIFGIIMIYSASYYNASKVYNKAGYSFALQQARAAVIGIVGMLIISMIDYHLWEKISFLGFPISIVLILLLKTPLGIKSHEAVRWIGIGPLSFQVAEPVKLFMILFLAAFIKKYPVRYSSNILRVILMAAMISGLIFVISDNMSTAIIIMGISVLLIFISHPNMKYFVIAAGSIFGLIAIVVIAIELFADGSVGGFRVGRILAWLHPTAPEYASGIALQASQALYAIGSGGFWGRGLGQSLIKFKMPEPHNDFILAIIAEELGAFGVLLLFFLFLYLLYRLYYIAQNAVDLYGRLIVAGVFCQIAIQVILNVAVVISVIPTTGVTLPFISYGGASICFLLAEFGFVFSVDKYSRDQEIKRRARRKIERQWE
ncbi:MAG: FtsW/RodA/SpoVE family cell cycle protein [Clostridiales bacterium]|nr:FtsW/RodA/SpoVE family cell cycle protein [Clostridiales bacterium]